MAFIELGRREPEFQEQLGSSLGAGISSALQQLAQGRIEGLKRQQTAKGLEALNFTPEQAQQLSMLPESTLAQLIKSHQQQQNYQKLGSLLGGKQIPQGGGGMGDEFAQQNLSQLSPEDLQNALISEGGVDPNTAAKLAETRLKGAKEEREVSAEARKYSAPFEERREASDNNIRDYNMLIDLAKTGELRTGTGRRVLGLLNLEDWGQGYKSELASKLVARLAQNVKAAFGTGTRITNFLEQTFQRSLPTLWNSAEGIILISKMSKELDKINIIKDDARKKILRQNNGKVSYDINDQINEMVADKKKKIEDKVAKLALSSEGIAEKNPKKLNFRGRNEWKSGATYDSLENAPNNAIVTDTDTGEKSIYKDGKLIPYQGA
jgi:hypothetical protein